MSAPPNGTRLAVVYEPGTIVRTRTAVYLAIHKLSLPPGTRGTVRRVHGDLSGVSVVHWHELDREIACSNDVLEPVAP